MRRKLTITVDDAVYEGLRRMVGQRKISQFKSDSALLVHFSSISEGSAAAGRC